MMKLQHPYKWKERKVYAGHRLRALRKDPLTSKLARASTEVLKTTLATASLGKGKDTEPMRIGWVVNHAPRRPDSPSPCIHLRAPSDPRPL
eukprot:1152118-Pelagomonas_calceolata.AAC.1